MADFTARNMDVDSLLQIARSAPALRPPEPTVFGGDPRSTAVRIAVARDRAFQFTYADNLDLLAHLGAEIVPFSPLDDAALPDDVDLLYLCGGYPEVYAAELTANGAMRGATRRWAAAGRPIFAECGGLMYLGQSLTTLDGFQHPMVGALPIRTRMEDRCVAIGYTTITLRRGCLLGAEGTRFRAHEFHWSSLTEAGPTEYAYDSERGSGVRKADGVVQARTVAGYAHVHFAAHPPLADALVQAALGARRHKETEGATENADGER
jgi:cobyrinic acid a,c-diamide synthase